MDFAGLQYEEVLRKYADMVTRVCVMRCGNAWDAKDCFQEVFLKLYICDKEFDTQEHLKAWLLQVAIHQCADFHKQAWKRKVSLEEDMASLELVGIQKDDNEESSVFLAVQSLPVKYREVIYLYYYEEYNVKEMAEILNEKENTVKSNLKRGRDKLREILGGKENERLIRI